MLADPEGILERAEDAAGRRRFYPPGAHPATHALRDELFRMERLQERLPYAGGRGRAEHAEWIRRKLVAFEIGEDVEKARYVLAHYRDLDRVRPW